MRQLALMSRCAPLQRTEVYLGEIVSHFLVTPSSLCTVICCQVACRVNGPHEWRVRLPDSIIFLCTESKTNRQNKCSQTFPFKAAVSISTNKTLLLMILQTAVIVRLNGARVLLICDVGHPITAFKSEVFHDKVQ